MCKHARPDADPDTDADATHPGIVTFFLVALCSIASDSASYTDGHYTDTNVSLRNSTETVNDSQTQTQPQTRIQTQKNDTDPENRAI